MLFLTRAPSPPRLAFSSSAFLFLLPTNVVGSFISSVQLVVENVPRGRYISQLLIVLAKRVDKTQLLEWELGWLLRLLRHHGEYIREHSLSLQSVFRALQRSLLRRQTELTSM